MTGRSLDPDERALWQRVTATVRALHRKQEQAASSKPAPQANPAAPRPTAAAPVARPTARSIGETLDGGWDRRLRRGLVAPDATIDLHGHTLASAHGVLDDAIGRSLAHGDRLLLVITGRPPQPGGESRRGAIRAALPDWLTRSHHAHRIAAVRGAHSRHGGAGALYLVLRRAR
jgi:DNA-nicking Smr family endonuclease